MDEMNAARLKQNLHGWQILFISLSAIIGGGVFANNGEALEIAGPGGMLLAVFIMGVTQIGVMEVVSEFVQKYPAPNAIFEYIRAFLDKEAAWACGIAYWYTYSSIFAAQNLSAANLTNYWGLSQTWQTIVFYIVAPLIMVLLNSFNVNFFGWIETVGGFLKVCFILGASIALYIFAGEFAQIGQANPISDGFQNNPTYTTNHKTATCYVIPLIAYSYLGVETITVAAFEARRAKDLAWTSRWIAYGVFVLYIMISFAEAVNLRWTDDHLPPAYGGVAKGTSPPLDFQPPYTSNMIVLAAWRAGYKTFAGFFNVCVIFSVLSAANTSLYIASRVMYGLAREASLNIAWTRRVSGRLSIVTPDSSPAMFQGVPLPAVLLSGAFFCWLPFLQPGAGYAVLALIEIIAVSASVSCLIVWAALCLSFIRYRRWLERNESQLSRTYREYVRLTPEYGTFNFLQATNSFPAYVGLCGCCLVFAFTSATWWGSSATFSKIAVAYAAPIILFSFWVLLKLVKLGNWVLLKLNHRSIDGVSPLNWVSLSGGYEEVARVCRSLENAKPADRPSGLRRNIWGRGHSIAMELRQRSLPKLPGASTEIRDASAGSE